VARVPGFFISFAACILSAVSRLPSLACLLPLALVLASPPVRADEQGEALRALESGIDHYKQGATPGELERARDDFERAGRLAPSRPNPHRWLGLTYARLGDCDGATLHLQLFLDAVPMDDPRRAEALALLESCRRAHPTLEPTPAPTPTPAPAPHRSLTAPLVLGIATVALLGAGAGLVRWTAAKYDDLSTTCGGRRAVCDPSSWSGYPGMEKAGWALVFIGVAAAGADGARWGLVPMPERARTNAWIAPTGLGVAAGGSF
jgi:hypothetical protein